MSSKEKLIAALFKLDKVVLDEAEQVLSEWNDIFSTPESKDGLTLSSQTTSNHYHEYLTVHNHQYKPNCVSPLSILRNERGSR